MSRSNEHTGQVGGVRARTSSPWRFIHEFVQVLPLSSKKRRLAAAGCAVALVTAAAACSSGGGSSSSAAAASSSDTGTVTVAVVSNPLITGQMIPLTQSVFEKENPGITVKFATYTEGDLRAAIEKDVSTHSNSFNVIMIGPYETPLFAKNGWLVDLTKQYIASDPSYDASDLLPAVAKALSYNGDLYAAPFYGESSMLYYNKTLLTAAGVTMPLHPTWAQVAGRRGQAEQAGQGRASACAAWPAGATTWPPSTR